MVRLLAIALISIASPGLSLRSPRVQQQVDSEPAAVLSTIGIESIPCNGDKTSKILQRTDTVEVVGCSSSTDAKLAFDGKISDFECTKTSGAKFGQLIVSNANRFSIVEGQGLCQYHITRR